VTTQIVRPAGAGYETAVVLSACALVVALAGTVIGTQSTQASVESIAAYQIDARRDLTPAEQGLYADLRIAVDELSDLGDLDDLSDSALPSVATLAESGVAPFVADTSQARRGGHNWQRLSFGMQVGYLGISHNADIAGDLLWLVGDLKHADDREPNIWLHRGEPVTAAPSRLDPASLADAGWRQIVAQFDAGVTRERQVQ